MHVTLPLLSYNSLTPGSNSIEQERRLISLRSKWRMNGTSGYVD